MDKRTPEYLLRLLAEGASLCSTDRAMAFPLLQQACALLWRLEPTAYPMSATELERKLSLPLEDWLPAALRVDYEGPLLYFNIATQTCNEMLLELEVRELWERVQTSVNRVKQACRLRAGGEAYYRQFRLFLIENPVIAPSQARDFFVPLNLSLDDFYQPIPPHLYHSGLLYLCPECRWPMNAQRHQVGCDSAWCQDKKSLFVRDGSTLVNRFDSSRLPGEQIQGRLMLKPAIWKFTLQPGLLEVALAKTLSANGFEIHLWPDVDRADLRVHIGSSYQEIDAKVWMSAYALARYCVLSPNRLTASAPWICSFQRFCLAIRLTTSQGPGR